LRFEEANIMTIYLHETPGRLRVTIPTLKGMDRRCIRLERSLTERIGVEKATVKSLTGSVVIYFDPDRVEGQELIEWLCDLGHIDNPAMISTQSDMIHQKAVQTGEALGRAIIGWAMGKALEANGLSLLAALI
jgi:hypothetical protein